MDQTVFDARHSECMRVLKREVVALIADLKELETDLENEDPLSCVVSRSGFASGAAEIERRIAELEVLRLWNISMCGTPSWYSPPKPSDDIPF